MRLPFPERIPIKYAAIFACVLFVVEQVEGTNEYFSLCVFCFILLATLAFNLAGGFTRPSGGYVFAYATLGAIVGWVWKACLGEAADSNLLVPNLTVTVFLGGIAGMTLAVYLSSKVRLQRGLLSTTLKQRNYPIAMAGCAIVGILLSVMVNVLPHEDGSFTSALGQTNYWLPVAILLGVTYEIRRTGGQRSVNPVVLVAGAVSFTFAVIYFSKEGMFVPILCYLMAAASMRYRVSLRQAAGLGLALVLMVVYMVPYSQYGRNQKSKEAGGIAAFEENAAVAGGLVTDLGDVKQKYDSSQEEKVEGIGKKYFDTDQGLMERLQMLLADDLLIEATERGRHAYGLAPLAWVAADAIPHFLWPDKPTYLVGNLYAQEIGGIIDDRDLTTGISFSPSADAYHMAGWAGVLLVAPAMFFVAFTFFDSIFGDPRESPWGLFVLVLFAHLAPEGLLSGLIQVMTRFAPSLVLVALICAYGMPVVAGLFVRPQQPVAV